MLVFIQNGAFFKASRMAIEKHGGFWSGWFSADEVAELGLLVCIIFFLWLYVGSRYFAVSIGGLLKEEFEMVIVFVLGEEDLEVGVWL